VKSWLLLSQAQVEFPPISPDLQGGSGRAATVHIAGTGSCTVTATQPGDPNHNAAPDVPQTFAIAATPKQPFKCVVPNVVGKPLATAKRMIERRHCRTGSVRYAYSRKTKKGTVIAQNRRPGRVLAAQSKIALIIGRSHRR
jgi:hypothetical protein